MANTGLHELMLLERVFLRLGAAETDEQLQNILSKFLPPVLLKLASQQDGVRNKVMELLMHVNKRIKTRLQIQLPVEVLLTQYQDPSANSFVTNFTIIYIRLGFPRLSLDKQVELVPIVLNALENKPQKDLDSMLLLLVPLLGKVKVPTEPEKITTLFGLNEKPQISKHLLGLLLNILLLPYGALPSEDGGQVSNNTLPVPPGMSEDSFKRITLNNPMKPEELEEIKLGIVKFLIQGVFKDEDILIHLIVAAADTRFSVANLADMEVKKIVVLIDWSSLNVSQPLFAMYLGTMSLNIKPELKKSPVSTRIRLKLLTYLLRATGDGISFPASIQLIFDSLYGENTNIKLKALTLNFTMNIIKYGNDTTINKMAPILLNGIQKLIINDDSQEIHKGQAYLIIGLLGQHYPKSVYHNIELIELFLKNLEIAQSLDLKLRIREGLLNLILAYKYDLCPNEINENDRLNIFFALIKYRMTSEEVMVRFVIVRILATIFPPNHVPSKFLLLNLTSDFKDDISNEAFKSLYGTSRKIDIDLKNSKIIMPKFSNIVKYIYDEAELIMKDSTKTFTSGSHILPFNLLVYNEILIYLRLCLIQNINDVPLTRDILKHPCEYSPIIREYLQNLYEVEENSLKQYFHLIRQFLIANPSIKPFASMVEIIGCLPQLINFLVNDINWIRDQLSSTKEEIREFAAILYAIIINISNNSFNEFQEAINYLINQTNDINLEKQHGALLAIGNCLELFNRNDKNENSLELIRNCVNVLAKFLKSSNHQILIGGACTSLGLISRCHSLPIQNGKLETNTSPNPKRLANDQITKIELIKQLIDIMNNNKLLIKIREKSIKTLGLISIGEFEFPFITEILKEFLNTSKDTKDIEVHFTIGESLVMCCQNIWSYEARNYWLQLPKDYLPFTNCNNEKLVLDENNLEWLLDELLKLSKESHPNSKQASCIWLLAILKGCGEREPITKRLQVLQNVFMDLLCENNDIVQDAASKALCVVYDTYKSEELLSALVKQLTSGTRQVTQVTSDTKLFEEGQLGASPTGGNLTTYKELCSLASDLNKPDLIYQFMHLANHNAIWNSKKGAAFGFSSIAEKCGDELKKHLPLIIPKLYRYQYDPVPNIQASMHNIWRVLVNNPQKMLDEYFNEILKDLLENLNSNQYRTRQSCCLALQDFLKGTTNRSIHDCINSMNELWLKLFRVMDDHHETTRNIAIKTTKILSKLCVRGCDISQGKNGIKMVEAILPPLLNNGITNAVTEIRLISLRTVSELVGSAGKQLKPFLAKIIPALLQATGELESSKLSYISTMLSGQLQAQETIDSARASFAKTHFTTETVSKSLQYADATILEELIPKIVDLMKSSVGLGTRIACTHFITLLVVQLGQDLQPYAGKLLATLVNGLTDRNAAVRKHNAMAIGQLVSVVKESSLEKLFTKLQNWYFEREDDSIRSACAYTIQSIGNHNQEILKKYSRTILPLVFFAMHSEKVPENEKTIEIWLEIWSENSPGTETGIKQNLESICNILKTALGSPSWTIKSQAANSVSTIATKLGSTMDIKHRNALINILLNGLTGRTWNGKDKLLKALASICTNCKDSIKNDTELDTKTIVDVVLRECRKDEIVYKTISLQCLGEIISALEIDRFDEIYLILQNILIDSNNESNEDEDGTVDLIRKRENLIKLKEIAYETLGKTWPINSKLTQDKYGEMFIEHCVNYLPKITRSIQVSIIIALYNFVDKLILLNNNNLNENDFKLLNIVIDNILIAIKYGININKHTKLRKECLNVIYCLSQKFNNNNNNEYFRKQFIKLSEMFDEVLIDLNNDNQPEIKTRVKDIKNILKQ